MNNYLVKEYREEQKGEGDDFVLQRSVNGTFLQTRNFLNYHPEGRFRDTSLMIYVKNHLAAVVPGCEIIDDGKRCFFRTSLPLFYGMTNEQIQYVIDAVNDF